MKRRDYIALGLLALTGLAVYSQRLVGPKREPPPIPIRKGEIGGNLATWHLWDSRDNYLGAFPTVNGLFAAMSDTYRRRSEAQFQIVRQGDPPTDFAVNSEYFISFEIWTWNEGRQDWDGPMRLGDRETAEKLIASAPDTYFWLWGSIA